MAPFKMKTSNKESHVKTKMHLYSLAAGAMLLTACGGSDSDSIAEPELDLASLEARVSYSLAYNHIEQLQQGGVEINTQAFLAGAEDALGMGQRAVSEEEMQAAFQEYQAILQEEAMAEAEAAAVDSLVAGEAFLAENATAEGVLVTESGLQYKILQDAEGDVPGETSTVRVHYTGRLLDGTVFDSSVERGEPVEFGVTQVIPGWTEALQMMPEGATWELYLHPDLAYGASGAGGVIGPNEVLIFEVELLEATVESEAGATE